MIDFIRGGEDFRTGSWQGYEGVDVDVVIDFGTFETITKLSAGFLQDQGSWIFMPEEVSYSISLDGKSFSPVGIVKNMVSEKEAGTLVREFELKMDPQVAGFLHVVAKSRKNCPEWHPGAGKKAWIFCDEITVE